MYTNTYQQKLIIYVRNKHNGSLIYWTLLWAIWCNWLTHLPCTEELQFESDMVHHRNKNVLS